MSTDIKTELTAETPAAEAKKKHRIPKKAWGYIAVAVGCTLLGTSMGTTEYVEVEKQVEVVEEVKVEVTPQACRLFSDAADHSLEVASKGFDIVGEMMDAVSRLDAAGVGAATDKLDQVREDELLPAMAIFREHQTDCLSK